MFVRGPDAQRVVSLVTNGTSVEVVGPRFSGRSTVMTHAAGALEAIGFTVISVRSVHSSSGLEAVRSALADRVRDRTGLNDSAAAVMAALNETARDGRVAIFIDDSERLDDSSWTLLESLHRRRAVPLVAATVSAPRIETHRLLSNRASPSSRVTLEPLTAESFHDIVEARLGCPVAPSLSARLNMKSAGRPGLALTHLESAIAHGRVRKERDYWTDDGDLWTPEIAALYEVLLAEHSTDVREATELLALAGDLPIATTIDLIGQDALENLEEHGLVQLFASDGHVHVAVCPPGLGTYFHSLPLSARRTRLAAHAINRLPAHSLQRNRLESADTAVGALPHDSDARKPVAERALLDRHRAALEAAKTAWVRDPVAPSALRYLRLLLSGERDERAIMELISAPRRHRHSDAQSETHFRLLHARWSLSQGVEWETACEPLRDTDDEPHTTGRRLARFLLETEFRGLRPDYESHLSDIRASSGAHRPEDAEGFDTHLAALALAWCHIVAGRGIAALDALDAVVTSPEGPMREYLSYCRGMALIACGRFQRAISHARSESRRATTSSDLGALAYTAVIEATALFALGQCSEIHQSVAPVLATSASSSAVIFGTDRALLVVLALAAVRSNRQSIASTVADQADALGVQTTGLPFTTFDWVDGVTIVQEGDKHAARRAFAHIETRSRSLGYHLSADTAQFAMALCDFDPAEASTLRQRAEAIGGDVYCAYLDARTARAQNRGRDLVTIAQQLSDLGATNEAFRFLGEAKKIFQRDRDPEGRELALEASRAVTRSAQAGVEDVPPSWKVEFTTREKEIINAAASGKSNAEIAESMFVSVRTVETHIRNIRRKSGVLGRKEMLRLATFTSV